MRWAFPWQCEALAEVAGEVDFPVAVTCWQTVGQQDAWLSKARLAAKQVRLRQGSCPSRKLPRSQRRLVLPALRKDGGEAAYTAQEGRRQPRGRMGIYGFPRRWHLPSAPV